MMMVHTPKRNYFGAAAFRAAKALSRCQTTNGTERIREVEMQDYKHVSASFNSVLLFKVESIKFYERN